MDLIFYFYHVLPGCIQFLLFFICQKRDLCNTHLNNMMINILNTRSMSYEEIIYSIL